MTFKFHWTIQGAIWLAAQLAGMKRTEMPGVMPKALEGDAVSRLRDLYMEAPAFKAQEMLDPTPEILLSMCKALIALADKQAGLPPDSSDQVIANTLHPSALGILKKFFEGKGKVLLPEAKPDKFALVLSKLLIAIHDEVNRPSAGTHDRTQFELNADDTQAKLDKEQKGKDALKDKEQKGNGKSKVKGKGKGKAKTPRPPAPEPASIALNSSSSSGPALFSLDNIMKLLAPSAAAPAIAPV